MPNAISLLQISFKSLTILLKLKLKSKTETVKKKTNVGSGHPTIRTPEEGISVLNRFQQMLVLPDAPVTSTTTTLLELGFRSRGGVTGIRGGGEGGGGEGFERIFRLNYESYPSPNYTPEDIHDILTRVSNAIPILPIQNPDPMAIPNASPNPSSDAYGYRYGYAYATDRNSNVSSP